MSTTILRFLVNRAARSVFKKSAEGVIEDLTGVDVPLPGEVIKDVADDLFDTREPTQKQLQEATRRAVETGRISRRDLEEIEKQDMVDFQQFVSVYAEKCGGGADEAATVWNREKSEIRSMTVAEVRQNLRCP